MAELYNTVGRTEISNTTHHDVQTGDGDQANGTTIAISTLCLDLHLLRKNEAAQDLFRFGPIRLILLWGINISEANLVLAFVRV